MPTVRQMVKQMLELEKYDTSDEPGAYPVMFRSDWQKIKFILLLRWVHFIERVKKWVKR